MPKASYNSHFHVQRTLVRNYDMKKCRHNQQQLSKEPQNDKSSILAGSTSNNANEGKNEVNASGPSNSVALDAIHSLRGQFTKQSGDMFEAINRIKGELMRLSQRAGETEQKITGR